MDVLAQFFRIALGLVVFAAAGVLTAPAQPTLFAARAPLVAAIPEPEPAPETAEPAIAAAEPSVPPPPPASPAPASPAPQTAPQPPVPPAAPTPIPEPPAPEIAAIAPPPEPEEQPIGLRDLTAEPPPLDFRLYRAPRVVGAARLEAQDTSIRIAGVEPISSCSDTRCERDARRALDGFLDGRAVLCSVAVGRESEAEISAPCLAGEEDIGAWLVANGWASASAGSRYREAEEAAQRNGAGLWATVPRG